MIAVECLAPAGLILGEGPIPIGEDGFACVDIRRHLVLRGRLDGTLDVVARSDRTIGAVAATTTGRLVVAERDRVRVLDGDDAIVVDHAAPDLRFNDGKPDPRGRFLCGTMADPPRAGAGSLLSFAHGTAHELVGGVTISNGLCWSADGTTMYYVDTPTRRVDAFDYHSDGSVSERRTVVSIPDEVGDPDGMTIDAAGGLWVALWGGGAVHRYVDGALDEIVEIPTRFPTCPAFVGPDLGTLLVTTASEPCPNEAGAGDLFVARPGLVGLAPHRVDEEQVFSTPAD